MVKVKRSQLQSKEKSSQIAENSKIDFKAKPHSKRKCRHSAQAAVATNGSTDKSHKNELSYMGIAYKACSIKLKSTVFEELEPRMNKNAIESKAVSGFNLRSKNKFHNSEQATIATNEPVITNKSHKNELSYMGIAYNTCAVNIQSTIFEELEPHINENAVSIPTKRIQPRRGVRDQPARQSQSFSNRVVQKAKDSCTTIIKSK